MDTRAHFVEIDPKRSPQRESSTRSAHHRDAANGRPTPNTPRKDPPWHMPAHGRPAEEAMGHRTPRQACLGLGTPRDPIELSDTAIRAADNSQARVEGGVRLRKEPRLCVSSRLVKHPCRSHGRLMVMTLAWRVDAVAHRRLRQPLAHRPTTVPHHSNHPTAAPT